MRITALVVGCLLAGAGTCSAANQPPKIEGFVVTPAVWSAGDEVQVRCRATDPEGTDLTFSWTAADGTILEAEPGADRIRWALPGESGNFMVKVQIADRSGKMTNAEFLLPVGPIAAHAALGGIGFAPARIAVTADETLWVTDPIGNRVAQFSKGSLKLAEFPTGPQPVGLAVLDNGTVVVGEDGLDRIALYSPDGTFIDTLGSGIGEIGRPTAIAVDNQSGRIYAIDSESARVRVFTTNGDPATSWGGHSLFEYPVDVAVNPNAGEVYVADQQKLEIFAFSPSGTLLRRFGTAGYAPGQFGRIQALEVDGQGQILVLDSYQNHIQLLTPTGDHITTFGYFGNWRGSLANPIDLGVIPSERVYVTSPGTQTIQSYRYWTSSRLSGDAWTFE
ncbi:NHL repeat-containing protein [bacterium]|nr:NHL repeat-containing protein [bacterium]